MIDSDSSFEFDTLGETPRGERPYLNSSESAQ